MKLQLSLVVLAGATAAVVAGLLVTDGGAGAQPHALQAQANGQPIQVVFNERSKKRLKVSVRTVTAGQITFIVENTGKRAHNFVVLKTNRKPRALPLKGVRARPIGRRGRLFVGPGKTRTLVLNLQPGRYVLIGNLAGHYLAGERARLVVTEARPSPAPTPTPSPAPSPTPSPTPPSSAARSLFFQSCGGCHRLADAGTIGAVGPNLDALRPSKAVVQRQVTNGGGGMPAFAGILTQSQIDAVETYVSQVAGQ